MTESITPPPELLEQWMQAHSTKYDLARQAAQWGADQELEACIEWLQHTYPDGTQVDALWSARRPKPPSLKEQALAAQQRICNGGATNADWQLIRRALEALPDD
jgi:hypothetical protein